MRGTGPFSVMGLALALALGLGVQARPAQAGFQVCNKTGLATRLALGHFDGTHWSSEGWWTIQPKSCASILTGALNARYYYLYATDQKAGTWEGSTHFCVAPEKRFRAVGRADCVKRGFARRGFFEVDTGNKPDWTQNLSD
jgi:uncharacterized membrane protein